MRVDNRRKILAVVATFLLVLLFCIPVGAQESTSEAVTVEEVSEYVSEAPTAEGVTPKNSAEVPIGDVETPTQDMESFYDLDAMKVWFEERVLPNLTSTLLIIGVGLLELIPAIRSLLKARGAFTKAAENADAYTEAKIAYDARAEEREKLFLERLEKYDAEIARTREETRLATEKFEEIAKSYAGLLKESEERLGATLHHVEVSAQKTEEMVYLGMSNSCELVQNGAARRIAEVEERCDDEDEE
ncbi:MAG: hypothetical protein E7643_01455 [Ruminococcaceae bacterium]|nr:hypothetical protein [Oscillospiraceae bacterium]